MEYLDWTIGKSSITSEYGDRIAVEGANSSSLDLSDKHKGSLEKLSKEISELRGKILSRFTSIESDVDEIIKLGLFKLDNLGDVSAKFDFLFLKAGIVEFSKKITLLKELANNEPILKKFITEENLKSLKKSMHSRNRFAHGNIVFINKDDDTFFPVIRYGQNELVEHKLDNGYFDKIFGYYKNSLDFLRKCYIESMQSFYELLKSDKK